MLDSANLPFFGELEFMEVRGILLFVKAKRSKNFVLGVSHGIIFY